MAEVKDGEFVGPHEDGADEDFKVVHLVLISVGWLVSMLKGKGENEEELNVIRKF